MQVDPAFVEDLNTAQSLGQAVCLTVFARLEAGMSHEDVAGLLEEEVRSQGATLLEPPRIEFGTQTGGGALLRHLRTAPLKDGELVSIDMRPIVGNAAGDYADTQVFGTNGRHWQYRRMAHRIYTNFVGGLKNCKTERDVIRLADECANERGFALFHPLSGLITHPIRPIDDPNNETTFARKSIVTNRLQRLSPSGSRPFVGIWSVEPRFLVEEVGYLFENVFFIEEGQAPRMLGGDLPEAGPWLA